MVEFGREPQDSENDGFDRELEAAFERNCAQVCRPCPRRMDLQIAYWLVSRTPRTMNRCRGPCAQFAIRSCVERSQRRCCCRSAWAAISSTRESARLPESMPANRFCSRSELPVPHCRMFETRWTATTRTIRTQIKER